MVRLTYDTVGIYSQIIHKQLYTINYNDPNLFIPMSLMALEGGPINIIPSSSQRFANSGFSDKNP